MHKRWKWHSKVMDPFRMVDYSWAALYDVFNEMAGDAFSGSVSFSMEGTPGAPAWWFFNAWGRVGTPGDNRRAEQKAKFRDSASYQEYERNWKTWDRRRKKKRWKKTAVHRVMKDYPESLAEVISTISVWNCIIGPSMLAPYNVSREEWIKVWKSIMDARVAYKQKNLLTLSKSKAIFSPIMESSDQTAILVQRHHRHQPMEIEFAYARFIEFYEDIKKYEERSVLNALLTIPTRSRYAFEKLAGERTYSHSEIPHGRKGSQYYPYGYNIKTYQVDAKPPTSLSGRSHRDSGLGSRSDIICFMIEIQVMAPDSETQSRIWSEVNEKLKKIIIHPSRTPNPPRRYPPGRNSVD